MNLLFVLNKFFNNEDILRLSKFLVFQLFGIYFPSSKQECTKNTAVTYLEDNLWTLSLFKMEPLPAIINDLYQLTSVAKSIILDIDNRL